MSYNIDYCDYLAGGLSISIVKATEFVREHNNELPEISFLEDVNSTQSDDLYVPIEYPHWCGNGSGYSYDVFLRALGLTHGNADILVTWEGGDSFTGLRVRDGEVTEKKVVQSLED